MTYNIQFTILAYLETPYEPVEYKGFDVFVYYFYLVKNLYAGYSWQIATAYNITLLSITALAILFCLFWLKIWREGYRKRKVQKLREYYIDKFRIILGSADVMTPTQMLTTIDKKEDEVLSNDPFYYAQMLEQARMEMYEIVYLPNMQILAMTLGVTDLFERKLLHRRDVFRTLQMMLMLQLTVSEGRLANYVNHSNPEIRMMARLCYITCSENDPYRFLEEDLSEQQAMFRPMLLNYIFGWMKSRDRQMPDFLNIAQRMENEDSAAYLVKEVAYWGSETEKSDVKKMFLSNKFKVRSAAIEVVSMLGDISAEPLLMDSYTYQPEDIRREVLKALLAMNTGKQTAFFQEAYALSTSRETRETALSCLYRYGNEGRRAFEMMRVNADEETRRLIDQVDSFDIISQLQGI